MIEPAGRTFICSVTFIDIVRYSEASIAQQMAMKARLNRAIARAVEGVAESERIILDTGDGAAICFLGDPEDALFAATTINRSALEGEAGSRLVLRTGVNLGPIKLVVDLNGRTNVVGDGINVAQRVMGFADEGEILVSRSYYEVVARLTEGNERLFQYMGVRRDKHVREHQLYAFSMHEAASPERLPLAAAIEPEFAPSPTEPPARPPAADIAALAAPVVVAPHALPQHLLEAEEQRLARYIGPLARIMIARSAPDAVDVFELRRKVAHLIADPADRSSYLGAPEPVHGHSPAAAPASAYDSPAAAVEPLTLGDDERRLIEQELARAIGPLARVLVRKALPRADDREALYQELAAQIRNEADRIAFLTAVRRLV